MGKKRKENNYLSVDDVSNLISVLGIAGVSGYEHEVNHCIGLNKDTCQDYNLLLCCAKKDTYVYRTKQKHRIQYSCIIKNSVWFKTLFRIGNPKELILLCTKEGCSLYHLLALLPTIQFYDLDYEVRDILRNFESCFRRKSLYIFRSPHHTNDIFDMLSKTSLSLDIPTTKETNQSLAWHFAMYTKNMTILKKFVMAHKQWNIRTCYDADRNNVLQQLIKIDADNELIKLVLTTNIDLYHKNTNGKTCFLVAVKHSSLRILDLLLTDYKDRLNIHEIDNLGQNALHLIARAPHSIQLTLFQRLMTLHISISLPDNDGNIPLFTNIKNGASLELINEMLKYQYLYNIHHVNHKGETLLHSIVLLDPLHKDMQRKRTLSSTICSLNIDMNIQNNDGRTVFLDACRFSNIALVQEFFKYPTRFNINVQDPTTGRTALHEICTMFDGPEYAKQPASKIQDQVVKLLIQNHIDLTITDFNGNRAADIACEYHMKSFFDDIETWKDWMDVNKQNKYTGDTLFHILFREEPDPDYDYLYSTRQIILKLFTAYPDVDLNIVNRSRETPLMLAENVGDKHIMKMIDQYTNNKPITLNYNDNNDDNDNDYDNGYSSYIEHYFNTINYIGNYSIHSYPYPANHGYHSSSDYLSNHGYHSSSDY